FSGYETGQWNPLKATLVPNWRGGTSLAGSGRKPPQTHCNEHKHRTARCPGTAWDNRTVIGVVADLPGWVEYLPRRRSGQATWRWPRVSEAVEFRPGRLLPLHRGAERTAPVPELLGQRLPGDPQQERGLPETAARVLQDARQ